MRNLFAEPVVIMQFTNPNPDDEKARLSVEQIWHQGCAAEALSDHDWKHFVSLARNRFYTYELGFKHASETKQREHAEGLQGGFVTELMASPGLQALWVQTEFRHSNPGKGAYKLMRRRKFKARFRFV